MRVSGHEELNGHVLTYVEGEGFDDEVLAGVTSYDSEVQFYSDDIDYDISGSVELSELGDRLDGDVERYPVEHRRLEDIAEGVEDGSLPLEPEQYKQKLGVMTDAEKARAKMKFFH